MCSHFASPQSPGQFAATFAALGALLAVTGCAQAAAPGAATTAPPQPVELPGCARPLPPDDSRYIVFFDAHHANLRPRARLVLDDFAVRWRQEHGQPVVLEAHVDAAEAGPRDRGLAAQRGAMVAKYLAKAGIPAWLISVHDVGAARPLVPTDPGVAEAQNREVDLYRYGKSVQQAGREAECRSWVEEHCLPSGGGSIASRRECEAALKGVMP